MDTYTPVSRLEIVDLSGGAMTCTVSSKRTVCALRLSSLFLVTTPVDSS
jgi:hypothetical protein